MEACAHLWKKTVSTGTSCSARAAKAADLTAAPLVPPAALPACCGCMTDTGLADACTMTAKLRFSQPARLVEKWQDVRHCVPLLMLRKLAAALPASTTSNPHAPPRIC